MFLVCLSVIGAFCQTEMTRCDNCYCALSNEQICFTIKCLSIYKFGIIVFIRNNYCKAPMLIHARLPITQSDVVFDLTSLIVVIYAAFYHMLGARSHIIMKMLKLRQN